MSNESKQNKLQCEIVRDLLPLYHDDVVSDVTKTAVKNHLDECKECSAEYDSLCQTLPLNAEENTSQNKYSKMLKKFTLKKILWCITIFAATLAVIAGIAYLLLMVPVIPAGNENIHVVRAYKYEDDGEDKFLLIYSVPHYTTPSNHNPEITYENETAVINFNLKHTIINPYEKEAIEYPWSWDKIFVLEQECSEIKIGDEIIWSEEKNGNDTVPEYVWEFDNEEVCGGSNTDDYSQFSFRYNDGRIVYWNIDGEIIYDEYPDDEGDYPPFPTN